MVEVGEMPPEVQPAQVQAPAPPKESFFTWLKKRVFGSTPPATPPPEDQPEYQGEGLSGTRTTEEINAAAQQIPATPEQNQAPTATSGPSEETPEPLSEVKMPSELPPPEGASDWRQVQYEAQQRARGVKTAEQLAEEARIDAENLAKLQQPTQTAEPPKVAPFITETPQETTLPEKVFQPQPEVPGEHQKVEEFLENKPQPSTETTIPVKEPAASGEQTIPVNIPPEDKVST